MLPKDKFDGYRLEKPDFFNDALPDIKTDGLLPLASGLPVRLSILISLNDFRRSQLGRCLETLARQDWHEFEVLIADNGHSQDLRPVIRPFEPYLNVKHIRRERKTFVACPTDGWKALLPLASGDVLAIIQPEMMFDPASARRLYFWHFDKPPKDAAFYQIISRTRASFKGRPTWVTLKPYFMSDHDQMMIDAVDWHGDLRNLQALPEFWSHKMGLSNMSNSRVDQFKEWPWWLAASCRADDPIWQDMPTLLGHASIDLWFINYRHVFNYVDITPRGGATCYHQAHARTSVAPVGEQDSVTIDSILVAARDAGRVIPPGGGR